jgi:polysaccharide export outer membrane protein
MLDPARKRAFLLLVTILGVSIGGAGCQVTLTMPGAGTDPASQPPGNGYPGRAVPTTNSMGVMQTSYPIQETAAPPGHPGILGQPVVTDHPFPEGTLPPGPATMHPPPAPGPNEPFANGGGDIPREITMVSHPPYTIAPPDFLTIDAVRLVPRPPYRLDPLEVLLIQAAKPLPGEPISGPYVVTPEGYINLGYSYGSVRVQGMTIEQAQAALRKHLGLVLTSPDVVVSLAQIRGMQQIRGTHLVRPDGTISLGSYGSVYIAGMTVGQARCVIEKYLGNYFLNPQISLDVEAYNSKFVYVIADGGGYGQQIVRLPVTGNETVLDAISQVGGLPPVASKKRIWVARPAPPGTGCDQVLPVDWQAITEGGSTATNYQLFPGDRVYVSANRLIAFDNLLAQILNPINRVLGSILLGAETSQTLRGNGNTSLLVR